MMSDRYHRQRLMPEVDQERLASSSVLLLGAGALGNEVLAHLAAAGVGHLLVVDFDRVELTNLHRTLLFREEDIGRSKAHVAAREARRINPELRVEAVDGDFRFALGLGYFRRAGVVAGCVDSIEARAAAAQLCALAGVPYIDGGTSGLIGEVRHYLPGDGPCYACTVDREGRTRILARWSCAGLALSSVPPHDLPALGATSGVVGSHQAMAVLLALLDRQQSWGTAHVYDGWRGRMDAVRLPRDPECPNHAGPLPIAESFAGTTAQTRALDLDAAFGPLSGLRLRHTLVVELVCPCGKREQIFRALAALDPEKVRCPGCGQDRAPATLTTILPQHPLWGRPLADLAVPPGDVVGLAGEQATSWVEIRGDLKIDPWERAHDA
jgi:molybdopterin/thiamine biosynthesis adenylyltransferase